MSFLRIMRPKLPSADRLTPYLKSIDASRTYSNFGPLALSLEDRLSEHYGLIQGTVTTAANATLGLAIALAAQRPPPGSLCAIPAWTFVASAHAALMAGLVPYFVDVEPETWAIDANKLADDLARAPAPVGAVMPVAPFGMPLHLASWEAFRSRTGLAVVIDAAAAFDSLIPGAVPSVVSLHATKVLGIGEGGFVVSTDPSLGREVRMRANFGFHGSRQAVATAFNAKLSEYHAAVGHAALDEWEQTRVEWNDAAGGYRRALNGSNRVALQRGFGEAWVGSTCLLGFGRPVADRIEQVLARCDIETRRWWGAGAHMHPATATFPRGWLPTTDSLASSTLAVPLYRDIGQQKSTTLQKLSLLPSMLVDVLHNGSFSPRHFEGVLPATPIRAEGSLVFPRVRLGKGSARRRGSPSVETVDELFARDGVLADGQELLIARKRGCPVCL
jgi:dTDP-4-amino-4,6-dideoxygalactose transaminase